VVLAVWIGILLSLALSQAFSAILLSARFGLGSDLECRRDGSMYYEGHTEQCKQH
jgi:hypothetical protein